MGVEIQEKDGKILVHGRGLRGLKRPEGVLDCGNSGTTTRLLAGILCGQDFDSVLTGDASIQKRPMKRVIEPLSRMGAHIVSVRGDGCAPPLHHQAPPCTASPTPPRWPSAQVKSAILLAGLYADGETRVTEPARSRDHTERIALSPSGPTWRTEGTHGGDPAGKRALRAEDPGAGGYLLAPPSSWPPG